MIDQAAAHLALRNRALTVVVCTTGETTLGASGSAFTRTSGSFVADRFAVGMELRGEGFSAANNEPAVITQVSALSLRVDRPLQAQPASGGRTLTVGIPSARVNENAEAPDPDPTRPHWREEFVPAPGRTVTYGGRPDSLEEETGLYVCHLYALRGRGVTAIRRTVNAALDVFRPGTTLDAGDWGVTVRGDPKPWAGQARPLDTGHTVVTITIPWRAFSRAAVS